MKRPKSILLVEDDKDDQEFFIDAIKEIENAIIYDVANNGKEALEKLNNSATLPDLIFTDINMPMMNGIECLSEIRKNPHTKNIPVIILTTSTDQIDFMRELGARAFIKKPSDGKILRAQLEQLINLDYKIDQNVANRTFQTYT